MFNPSETGLHGPYITRKMRRRAERQLPPDQRKPKNTLRTFLAGVRAAIPGARLSTVGRPADSYMLFDLATFGDARKGGRMVASFRHPTKAATAGRMAFITVTS